MKILPDSNIFIEYWKDGNENAHRIAEQFVSNDIVVCGVVRAELLHGAVSFKHFQSMTAMLDSFEEAKFETDDWQRIGESLFALRTHGLTVPFADVIIASVAIKNDIPVWTNDRHFPMIQTVLGELRLMQGIS